MDEIVRVIIRGRELWIEDKSGCTGFDVVTPDTRRNASALLRMFERYGVKAEIVDLNMPPPEDDLHD